MTTLLHDERLAAVVSALGRARAARILDLGCGDGPLLLRLAAEPDVERVVGVDLDRAALGRLAARLRDLPEETRRKVTLVHGSFTEAQAGVGGIDAAVLVETIEHLPPDRLSLVERAVFRRLRPPTVIVTTPNAEFNPLLGVPPTRFRHPDHRFEWDRRKFRRWADGVAERNGCRVGFEDIAGAHPELGGASQMAVFELGPEAGGRRAT